LVDVHAAQSNQPILLQISGPNGQFLHAHVDTQASVSCISPTMAAAWNVPVDNSCRQLLLANGSKIQTQGIINCQFGIKGQHGFPGQFWVIPSSGWHVLLGIPELSRLPVTISVDGFPIFRGAAQVEPTTEPPTLKTGEGINFSSGTHQQQAAVQNLLLEYKDNIFEWSGRYGLFRDYPETLPVTSEIPIRRPPFHVGQARREAFQEILEENLARGIIEPSVSPWAAPAFLVEKKGADPTAPASRRWRFCVDYRKLNDVTIDLQYPVRSVRELLDALGGENEFFCTLDLRMGYHHIPLSFEARQRTAFTTPQGQFQYRVMPFGPKRAPRFFQMTMEHILKQHLWTRCLVYIDDIIIFGKDFNSMLSNLRLVMDTLAKAGASFSIQKCHFLAQQVDYLGHVVDKHGCRPNPKIVQAIQNFPQPETR
jgi:hypothetical protein